MDPRCIPYMDKGIYCFGNITIFFTLNTNSRTRNYIKIAHADGEELDFL